MNKVVDRLGIFLKSKRISEVSITEQIGVSRGTISAAKRPNRDLTRQVVDKVLALFPELSRVWLLTGEGDMLMDPAGVQPSDKYGMVAIYNLDVTAGMNRSLDQTDCCEYVVRRIPFPDAHPGDVGFMITGDSMVPAYTPGSIVVVREVLNWQEYFGFGNTFVLLLADGRRILKKISKSRDNNSVLAVSLNPSYDNEDLPKTLIKRVYKVVATFRSEGF